VQPSGTVLEVAVTADVLAPIANRLATLIRLLSSDKDGEVLAAARAMVRTLKAKGVDIHALAECVESPNGKGLTDAEMQKLYNAGYAAGVQAAESKQDGNGDFHNIDGTPSWHEMACWIQQRSGRLRDDREREFVDQMTEQTVWREPSERQGKWLLGIWHRLGSGRAR
jgi:hypothetical protein